MTVFNMHDAKTQLSDLVARAEAGEEIVIARRNKLAVRLVPLDTANTVVTGGTMGFGEDGHAEFDMKGLREAVAAGKEFTIMQNGKAIAKVAPASEKKPRVPGRFKGQMSLPESFFEPLSDDELDAWDGKYSNDGTW